MLKVLMVNPVIRESEGAKHVPFGLAQLAAITAGVGCHVQVFDCNAWRPTKRQVRDVLRADDWDVVCMGGLVTTYGFVSSFAATTRQERPKARIVLGGGIITPIPEDIMALIPEIDVGVIGEGYRTWAELLRAFGEDERDLSDIDGIIWRDKVGELQVTPCRALVEELDTIPFPAWDMFPLERYFANSSLLLSEEAMLSCRRLDICCSYGCPHQCRYCFHLGLSGELETREINGHRTVVITRKRKVRWHSPQYVTELMAQARMRHGVDFFSFLDENFVALDRFTKGRWLNEFETLQESKGLRPGPGSGGPHWGATCHASLAEVNLLRRLRSMGCSYLDFGFESFSDVILKEMHKGSTKHMNIKALEAAHKAGIRAIPNQIIGFPNETVDTILESLETWLRYDIQAAPFLATPYPGSEWYYTFKERILGQYDGSLHAFLLDLGDATKVTAVISENFNAVELLGLRELMAQRDIKRISQFKQEKDSPGHHEHPFCPF